MVIFWFRRDLRIDDNHALFRALKSGFDVLPIFIFVTVHAELDSPLKDKECMWSLCEPDMVAGEGGYYLTVFDAALSYLKVCDSSAV